jgi:hypothetical protein
MNPLLIKCHAEAMGGGGGRGGVAGSKHLNIEASHQVSKERAMLSAGHMMLDQ